MTGVSEPVARHGDPAGRPCPLRRGAAVLAATALVLVLATLAVYWPVGRFAFTCFDDQGYVYENLHVKTGLTWDNVLWATCTTEECNWHPLTWWSHMLDCEVYGLGGPRGRHLTSRLGLHAIGGPGGHHVTNLLLHLGATLLLFAALRRMTSAVWPSAAAAALFAIHPLHVESVAWVAERKDVLSGFFWMLTLWLYARYAERPCPARFAAVFLSLGLGLASKAMLVTLPLVLLLLDYWPLRRIKFKVKSERFKVKKDAVTENFELSTLHFELPPDAAVPAPPRRVWPTALWLILEKAPLFGISAIVAYVTYHAQHAGGSMGFASGIDLETRVANALVSYAAYLGKTVAPVGLSPFYPYVDEIEIWRIAGAAAVMAAVTALVVWQVRRRPYLAVGWLWYLGTLVPVIGLVQVGQQSMADRYTYVPLVGVFMGVAWLAADAAAALPLLIRYALVPAVAGAFAALGLAAIFQVWTWSDSVALFSHALEVTQNNSLAHNNLGVALRDVGRDDEAMEHFYEALAIKPDYSDAHNNLGIELAAHGRPDDAIKEYQEAIRLYPDFPEAEENIGIVLYNQGRNQEAVEHLEKAVRLRPHYSDAHYNMALALAALDRTQDAVVHYRECVRLSPDDAVARRTLGRALIKLGRYEEAAAELGEALRISPADTEACRDLAEVLGRLSQEP